MLESDWYEEALEAFREARPTQWPKLADTFFVMYGVQVQDRRRSAQDIRGILETIAARVERESMPVPFMVISAPDGGELTPDDLVINPAWNELEIDALWDMHDGRNLGTMIVGVYRWDQRARVYARDMNWGILGHPGDRRPAGPGDTIA